MTRAKWTWLLFPLTFTIAYVVITWACWVPLLHAEIIAQKNGRSFAAYWLGGMFAFTVLRIVAAMFLFVLGAVLVLPARWWQPSLLGALTGATTSILDWVWVVWANKYLDSLFAMVAMPAIAACTVIPIFLYYDRRRRRVVAPLNLEA